MASNPFSPIYGPQVSNNQLSKPQMAPPPNPALFKNPEMERMTQEAARQAIQNAPPNIRNAVEQAMSGIAQQKPMTQQELNALSPNSTQLGGLYDPQTQGVSQQLFPDRGGGFWSKVPEGLLNLPNYTRGQYDVLNQLRELGMQGVRNQFPNASQQLYNYGWDQYQNPYQGFAPIAQGARENFYTNTVPSIAERFVSMGTNPTKTSEFAKMIGTAGRGLNSDLASLQSNYGLQNRSLLQALLQLALSNNISQQGLGQGLIGSYLQPQFKSLYTPGEAPGYQRVLGGVAEGVGKALPVIAGAALL